jgi:hypothetical protein
MYEIAYKDGRYIVYRVAGKRHLRQGSFLSEAEALTQIERSKRIQALKDLV